MKDFLVRKIDEIRDVVGGERVLLGLSGGVDSSVCAALLARAVPGQLVCVFVDHGLMRHEEGDMIEGVFGKKEALRFVRVDGRERFLARLCGVTEPETKRKIIGEEFLRVFEEEAVKLGEIKFLAQGTLLPDIIESENVKSHHNVGGLPKKIKFAGIIEPLAELYKAEVRALGKELRLPAYLLKRPPFPGPGLAIRIIGEVTEDKLDLLRKADAILHEEIKAVRRKPDQFFAVLCDMQSVGMVEGKRAYGPVMAIRAVNTVDFMKAEYSPLSHKVLGRVSKRIGAELPGVSRVVYDVSSKPPATIEWE